MQFEKILLDCVLLVEERICGHGWLVARVLKVQGQGSQYQSWCVDIVMTIHWSATSQYGWMGCWQYLRVYFNILTRLIFFRSDEMEMIMADLDRANEVSGNDPVTPSSPQINFWLVLIPPFSQRVFQNVMIYSCKVSVSLPSEPCLRTFNCFYRCPSNTAVQIEKNRSSAKGFRPCVSPEEKQGINDMKTFAYPPCHFFGHLLFLCRLRLQRLWHLSCLRGW